MVSPKAMEAWFTLMVESAKGAGPAQNMFSLFQTASPYPDDLSQMMTRFMSGNLGTMPIAPDNLGEWYEEWCRLMGLVPRSRYVELLERYDILKHRLEESESKIRHLQLMVGVKGQEEEAKKMLDLWGTTLEKTLQAQSDWLKGWTAPAEDKPQASSEKSSENNNSEA